MTADILVWLVTSILESVLGLLVEAVAAVFIWYTIVLASPRAGRSITNTMLHTVEKRERELRERGCDG